MGAPGPVRRWFAKRAFLWVILAVALTGVSGTVIGYVAAPRNADWSRAFWLEVAKAGVQILAVAGVGGLAAAAWKARERRLEARAERRSKIRAELAELVVLYNDVKRVRRTLRSLGLDAKLHVPHVGRKRKGAMDLGAVYKGIERTRQKREKRRHEYREDTLPDHDGVSEAGPSEEELARVGRKVRLTEEQARGFHEQMQILNTLQLGYEAQVRQFEQADLLGDDITKADDDLADNAKVVKELMYIEKNLNDLVNLWEEYGWMIRQGTPLAPVSDWLQPLFRQNQFKPSISTPMKALTKIINKHLFGAPDRPTKPQETSAGGADHQEEGMNEAGKQSTEAS